jgi:hypothetical protein
VAGVRGLELANVVPKKISLKHPANPLGFAEHFGIRDFSWLELTTRMGGAAPGRPGRSRPLFLESELEPVFDGETR